MISSHLPPPDTALILVDIQNDFLPGGSLAVPDGDAIIPLVNEAMALGAFHVIATRDWHPANHCSFAANHPGKEPFDSAIIGGLPTTLWPTHCVQNTYGAEFGPALDQSRIDYVFSKGMGEDVESFSGFYDARRKPTLLGEYLRETGIRQVVVAGLATDYCVRATVIDALSYGFPTSVWLSACRGIDAQAGDIDRAVAEMEAAGAVAVRARSAVSLLALV
ncbi:bifunctional nicotinamidase/pyrazinamidase [Verrucomicrobia bacterium LW23]|nr:bifunctional nicotinamidase/pyrazinamidase [Verrucomicrobia bacterium LW23]